VAGPVDQRILRMASSASVGSGIERWDGARRFMKRTIVR
jgi:hypothetical protein